MRKIVINTCYGGFSLSLLAQKMVWEAKHPGIQYTYYLECDYDDWSVPFPFRKVTDDDLKSSDSFYSLYASTADLGDMIYKCRIQLSDEQKKHFEWTEKDYQREQDTQEKLEANHATLEYIDAGSSIERDDKDLIRIIEELGLKDAAGDSTELQICEIADDDRYIINEYDGCESLELESQVHNKNWK